MPEVVSKIQRAEKPLQNQVNRSFNLKTIFDKEEVAKKEPENFENLPKNQFSNEDVQKYWMEFLQQLQQENNIPAFNALSSGKVVLLDDFVIQFLFGSKSLINELQLQKEKLIIFLREKLNNYSLKIQEIVEHDESVNYIKTKADLFQELAKKNPILLKMKDELGFDLNSND